MKIIFVFYMIMCVFNVVKGMMYKMNNNISKREKFHRDAFLYFDNELVREIFYTDDFSICNIANSHYAVFFYPSSSEGIYANEKRGPSGLFVSSDFMRDIIHNPSNVSRLSSVDEDTLLKYLFRLNQDNFLKIKQLKDKTDLEGPSSKIDLSLEEELLKKGYGRR